MVSDPSVLRFVNTPDNFRAGKISECFDNWSQLTSDPFILDIVRGYDIEFEDSPVQMHRPRPLVLNRNEDAALQSNLCEFSERGVIVPCASDCNHVCRFLSNLFVVPKRDDSFRVIFNVKALNEFVQYHHFKMDTLREATQLVFPDCFMASIDFKHAYFSVGISPDSQEYLCFPWNGQNYHFSCLPQGLSSAPRIFTKLLKPPVSHLRELGHTILTYIDDSLLIAGSEEDLLQAIHDSSQLFDSLGLTVHPGKSVLTPTTSIEFLGGVIDSRTMTVSLTSAKKDKIAGMARTLLGKTRVSIRDLASFIGNIVAAASTVYGAPLRTKGLEISRNIALAAHHDNYEALLTLSTQDRLDLTWWLNNVHSASMPLVFPVPTLELTTDASHIGWGAVFQGIRTGGHWDSTEAELHINILELKACFLALQALCADRNNCGIKLFMDNTTAVACVNRMGSIKPQLFALVRELFEWAEARKLVLMAAHIPGVENVVADAESRNDNVDTEWMLDPNIFSRLTKIFSVPDMDGFASRLNRQLPVYVAYRPDPHAFAIDVFSFSWTDTYLYLFPPFSVIGQVLRKLLTDRATCLLILPWWTTRPWWNRALELLIEPPRLLPARILHLPQDPHRKHPLEPKLRLLAMKLSGDRCKARAFRTRLSNSCQNRGVRAPLFSTKDTYSDGVTFVVQGKLVHCSPI